MSLIFINHPLETFTPTASGALATIIYECCRVAAANGKRPAVITRTTERPMFTWDRIAAVQYPTLPSHPVVLKAIKAHRKLTGWNHLRHKAYAVRVSQAIDSLKSPEEPLVLINDPEMVIYFRSRYPARKILHWFENQQAARPRIQRDYKQANAITCGVSDFTSRWVAEYYGVSNVVTLYNGVDVEQFAPAPSAPGVPFINFVGRTGVEKAPDLLLKSAVRLSAETRSFGVQLVGSNHWDRFELDDYQQGLAALVKELETAGIEVRRPGHVGRADLPMQFHRAHVHVVPSRWDEPFGLTTVEGMASGLAVAASKTGGTPEVVGDAGMLFERDSVDELTACLKQLVTDESLRTEFSRRARERALLFPWQRTWSDLANLTGVA